MDELKEHEAADDFSNKPPANWNLETFDFIENAEKDPRKIAIPSEIPKITGRGQIPLELQRSAAIESLLAQNEDLMARLKVNLRRLTQSENEMDELRKENRRLTDKTAAMSDQTSVFSEKEAHWAAKMKSYESQIGILQGKAALVITLQEKVDRYKKYQERIKTQVKPFVQQLKGYADNLNSEVQKLYGEAGEREHEIEQLKAAKARLQDQLQETLHRNENHQTNIIEQFEKERESLAAQLVETRARCHQLELDSRKIDIMRSREDELENLVVALKRDKEFQFKQQQEIEQDLKAQLGQIRSHSKFQEAKLEDLEKQNKAHQEEKARLSHQQTQLQEQIGSLRFMWSGQSQELEKTKAALAALEKLNLELSRKLNSTRMTSHPSDRFGEALGLASPEEPR